MKTEPFSFFHINCALSLAAALALCLSFSPNTLASPTMPSRNAALHENWEVLTVEDAATYRAIFEAQNRSDWKNADLLIGRLTDKRLMGHVLADRYERGQGSLPELQAWLAAYRDLPEADDIYRQAQHMPGHKNVKLSRPLSTVVSGGNDYDYDIASGFRNQGSIPGRMPSAAYHAVGRIQAALHDGDPDTAKNLLEETVQQDLLSAEAAVHLQSRLAAGFFYNGNTEEARRLTEGEAMQDDARALWINGLSNFHGRHYTAAAEAFTNLAGHEKLSEADKAAAAFWAFRAFKRAGETEQAKQWLATAASNPRSFYGLLASNMSGQSAENSWSWRMPEFNQSASDILNATPAGARALALAQVGQNDLAERELRNLNSQGRRPLQEAMLAFAEKTHMASLAMKIGGMASDHEGRPYDAALYPVPRWQPKDGFRVDRALIYALMRHESRFDPMAVSSQGACGLMQLMPATAERMNGSSRATNDECPDQFFDPVTNVGLGQNYVRHLAGQPMIGDNLLLLLAAYNGGPGRLSQRAGTEANADPLLFMERLPSQETHDYVQQVLIQYWTYRARLHEPLQSLAQLAHGEWPRFALRDTGLHEAVNSLPADSFAVASAAIH